MHYLYGSTENAEQKLVATFDTEEQLRSYLNWATLRTEGDGTRKFEQGSALSGFSRFDVSAHPLTAENETDVFHNPTPSML